MKINDKNINLSKNRRARSFTIQQVIDALEAADISCAVENHEVNADIDNCGRHHVKINPHKGVWFDAADPDSRGTVAGLLYRIGTQVPYESDAPKHNTTPIQTAKPKHDTQKRAVEIWKSAWLCKDGGLPPAWDKDLNAAHKCTLRVRLEYYRKTVRAYLTDRLGADHLDHWMQHVRITTDRGSMLTPMSENGVIVGIQRTFFDDAGKKSERKMLGHHGVQVLPPPASVLPQDLSTGSSKIVLVGEGFETVASSVQASGWPGIACHFDGGMVRFARAQVERAKTMAPEQIKQAAACVFLVDNDVSQAGQRASAKAVRILREAGLRAFYAIPPSSVLGGPVGGEKGSDWGDYPKEGISSNTLTAHLALAVAHGDHDMPAAPDEEDMQVDADDGQYSYAWHPAQTNESAVNSQPVADVRIALKTTLQQTVDDYMRWIKKNDEKFPPVLMMPTTGTGKTSAVKSLIHDPHLREVGGRVCVFVPDHKQAREYEKSGFFHFYGRNPDPEHPGYCPNHETLQVAQEKHHIPQAEVCKSCVNGHRRAINYFTELDPVKHFSHIENNKKFITNRGFDWQDVVPCRWLDHQREALDAQFMVAASGSYSHTLTNKSLVILDEHFDVGKGIRVSWGDVDAWARRNNITLDRLRTLPEVFDMEPIDLSGYESAAAFFQKIASEMEKWLGKTGVIRIDQELTETIQNVLKIARESQKSQDDVVLAEWETLQFDRSGKIDEAPLRAAYALAESLEHGDGYVEDGALVVAASLPIMERITHGQPTIIMDATPDPVIADVVGALGGKIVNAIATQHVIIKRYASRFWGLTALNERVVGPERYAKEVAKYASLINHHFTEDTAYLMHARAYDAVGFNKIILNNNGEPVGYDGELGKIPFGQAGYWGRDHRAHDQWTGKTLVMIGSFYPPPSATRAMYQESRIAALSAGANPEHWPLWSDDSKPDTDTADDNKIKPQPVYVCEGGMDVRCYLPLPSDPHIRDWLLARITSETVQAIGRARGANADQPITVHIYGGVPLAGLGQYGLTIGSYDHDPDCVGQSRAEYLRFMRDQREIGYAQCDDLAARIIAQGRTITRDLLRDEFVQLNADLNADSYSSHVGIGIHTYVGRIEMPRNETIQDWIKSRRPTLSAHMSVKGKSGSHVREACAMAKAFGEAVLREGMAYVGQMAGVEATRVNIERRAQSLLASTVSNDVEQIGAYIALSALDNYDGDDSGFPLYLQLLSRNFCEHVV